jgi:hypothetical protein
MRRPVASRVSGKAVESVFRAQGAHAPYSSLMYTIRKMVVCYQDASHHETGTWERKLDWGKLWEPALVRVIVIRCSSIVLTDTYFDD